MRLAGIAYDVRVKDGAQQVRLNGCWIDRGRFVDTLMARGQYEAVCDLARIGLSKAEGTLFDNSPQRTADMLQGARHN